MIKKRMIGLSGALQSYARRERFPAWYHRDNGFDLRRWMDRAHEPIVQLALATLSYEEDGNVLDLGCGNGALLKKIYDANAAVVPFGVELSEQGVYHARELLPKCAANFYVGDIFETDALWQRQYAMAIITPKRLLEAGPEKTTKLLRRIKQHCEVLLVYAYGESLTQFGDLEGIARHTGILLRDTAPGASAALADLSRMHFPDKEIPPATKEPGRKGHHDQD